MTRLLMVLTRFHGVTGDAQNERRLVMSLAGDERVQVIYVFALAGMVEFLHPRTIVKSPKVRVFTFPRIPSPAPIFLMSQFVFYGFFFALIAAFLKRTGIIDSIYIRSCYLAFGCVSLRRLLEPVTVKVVMLTTREIFFESNVTLGRTFASMFGGSVENYVIRRTGLIFTVPGSFTEVLQRIRGRSKGIVELPQPIPAEFFSIPKVHRESGKELVVGYVGTVDAIHSVATILQAVSSVQQDLPNVRLLLACDGDPRYLSKITNMMKSLGLRASVMLRVPNSRMPAVYKSLDLLLAPSSELLRDVVTLKVIEAIAGRVPFLAQKGKAMSALLRDSGVEHTVLVDRDDPSVWAQRIKALLLDSDLRRSVAARTFEFLRSPIECHTERAVANVFLESLAEYESENNT